MKKKSRAVVPHNAPNAQAVPAPTAVPAEGNAASG